MSGRRAVIVGVGGHLGTAVALAALDAGYSVFGSVHGGEVPALLRGRIDVAQLDIADDASIESFCAAASASPIDFFTNTIAHPFTLERFEKIPHEQFVQDMTINALQQLRLLRLIMPYMREGGSIVIVLTEMINSDEGKYASSYLISKYALLGVFHALVHETAAAHLRISAVSPGLMDTPFTQRIPAFVKEQYRDRHDREALLTPPDVARVVLRLAADTQSHGKHEVVT